MTDFVTNKHKLIEELDKLLLHLKNKENFKKYRDYIENYNRISELVSLENAKDNLDNINHIENQEYVNILEQLNNNVIEEKLVFDYNYIIDKVKKNNINNTIN
jgi:hypothetical protein